jgi:hypothetical protein
MNTKLIASRNCVKRLRHANEQRRSALSRFRIKRQYLTRDKYVKAIIERREDSGRRIWLLHAQLEGMTETELREFARVTGIELLDSGRKTVQDVAPSAKPKFTSSEPPRKPQ